MTDEYVIVDGNAIACERMPLNPAVCADKTVALDLDLTADGRIVADLTAVEVREDDVVIARACFVADNVEPASRWAST